ncbi:hypothetical protein J3Q64DRAFT_1726543 [Phycomyces blakesleeanus]|uniref:Uncharacterized protein n=1 Tax=Phycomyces blakesleeanus TaxID=4837 RepID=A0ABR3BA81_PHYBL
MHHPCIGFIDQFVYTDIHCCYLPCTTCIKKGANILYTFSSLVLHVFYRTRLINASYFLSLSLSLSAPLLWRLLFFFFFFLFFFLLLFTLLYFTFLFIIIIMKEYSL